MRARRFVTLMLEHPAAWASTGPRTCARGDQQPIFSAVCFFVLQRGRALARAEIKGP